MNILQAEDLVKGLPDQVLMQKAQAPDGQVPQYLFVSEIQRRSDMRKRFQQQQQEQPQGTVKDQIMQEGIASLQGQPGVSRGTPPQGMPQQGMPPQGPPQGMPPQGPPQGMPPQGMAGGGVVRMFGGGQPMPQVVPLPVDDGKGGYGIGYFKTAGFADIDEVAAAAEARQIWPERVEPGRDTIKYDPSKGAFSALGANTVYTDPVSQPAAPATPMAMDELVAGRGAGIDMMATQPTTPAQTPNTMAMQGAGTASLPDFEGIGLSVKNTVSGWNEGIGSLMSKIRPETIPGESNRERGERLASGMSGAGLEDRFPPAPAAEQNTYKLGRLVRQTGNAILQPGPQSWWKGDEPLAVPPPWEETSGGITEITQASTPTTDPEELIAQATEVGRPNEEAINAILAPVELTESAKQFREDQMKALQRVNSEGAVVQSGTLARLLEMVGKKGPATPDFGDLITQQKRDAYGNALVQLGAGIAGGDMAGGWSRAGIAAAQGQKDARDLAMSQRVMDYRGKSADMNRDVEILGKALGNETLASRLDQQMGLALARNARYLGTEQGRIDRAALAAAKSLAEARLEQDPYDTAGYAEIYLQALDPEIISRMGLEGFYRTLQGMAGKGDQVVRDGKVTAADFDRT